MTVKSDPESVAVIYVRVPGWLKNAIADQCAKNAISVNRWAANILLRAYEEDHHIPEAPPAQAPLPTVTDVIRGYLTGETVLEPCGREAPCEREVAGAFRVAGVEYCNFCRIRVE